MAKSDELRSKDLSTASGLRRRVVELEMEVKKLRELVPQTVCRDCRSACRPDGIFIRCTKQGMRVCSPDGFCEEGRPRIHDNRKRASGAEKQAQESN